MQTEAVTRRKPGPKPRPGGRGIGLSIKLYPVEFEALDTYMTTILKAGQSVSRSGLAASLIVDGLIGLRFLPESHDPDAPKARPE